jgi:hypothetical protein
MSVHATENDLRIQRRECSWGEEDWRQLTIILIAGAMFCFGYCMTWAGAGMAFAGALAFSAWQRKAERLTQVETLLAVQHNRSRHACG